MKYALPLIVILTAGCLSNSSKAKVDSLQSELDAARNTILQLEQSIEQEGDLVHLVFLKLKPGIDQAALIDEIKRLEQITPVRDLEVGLFEDLEDPRAMSAYDIAMQMSFDETASYEQYQAHPIHLALKESLLDKLAGPPVTYDFFKK